MNSGVTGWRLGGVYARLAALAGPEDVRAVITLGSPFAKVVRDAATSAQWTKW
jgi:hypothetical protein